MRPRCFSKAILYYGASLPSTGSARAAFPGVISTIRALRCPDTGDLRYLGESRIQTPLNTVLVVFGGRDSHTLDRALIERYFPDVLSQGVAPQMRIWILLDHEGRVLRTGEEAFDSGTLKTVLETRYAGIRTAEMTTSQVLARDGKPVTDSAGEALQLHCVWLAPGSPTPGEP
jgi:hypothetical protein